MLNQIKVYYQLLLKSLTNRNSESTTIFMIAYIGSGRQD